ncbi:Nsp1-like C-terminal region-domain-containing protein [Aspergillus karnatakaensis]|uniref:putative nucleoporin Nsp1 n=1 Tax=Aspergillus karnatakaensis TaxID=1810916 RepID=UPI003CCCFC88
MSGFNFTSGASGGGMFGSAGSTSNNGTTGGIFGNIGGNTAGASGSPAFGAGNTANKTPSVFGGGSNTPSFNFGGAATSSGQSPSLLGGASQTPKSAEGATSTPAATGGLFANLGKTQSPLLSNTTATPSQSGTGSLFPSTTPAGNPPLGGGPAQGQGLFAQKPGGLFGGATSSQPQPSAPASTAPGSSFLSGSSQTTGTASFQPSTQQSSSSGGLTGAPSSGTSSGLFGNLGASKPAEATPATATTAENATKPMFGGAPASTQPSTLFGAKTSGADATPKLSFPSLGGATNSETTSSTTPQKSPFSLPGATTTSATPSSTPAAAPASGGLFPGLGAAKPTETSTAQTTSTAAPSTTTDASTKPAPATATSGATPAAATTATAATPGLGASTAGPPPPAQSRLKNKTMDEIITRWATDLTKYQKDFREQAELVAEWDRMIVDNASKIQKIYGSTVDAERATQEVERQLSSVEGQQDELSSWLDRYEREVDEMMSKQVGPGETLQGPDQERERTYKLAEKLSDRLDEMGKDLSSMIEEVNSASSTLSKTSKADEPISQIVRILNSHLSQLQTIDVGTTELQTKVAAAQKAGQSISSRFGHGHSMSGSMNGNAADDFYRSYMGRR